MDESRKKSILGEPQLLKVIKDENEEEGRFPLIDDSRLVGIGTKKSRRTSREMRDRYDSNSYELLNSIMDRAQKVQANLNPEFPSFINLMSRSYVTKSFYMGIPMKFCKQHMPKHDESILLVGEKDKEYKVNFLARNHVFSGGWKRFSLAHKLQEGDVGVFQLVNWCKFKVYIVRRNDVAEEDGVLHDNPIQDARSLKRSKTCKTVKKRQHPNIFQNDAQREEVTSFPVTKDQPETSRKDSLSTSSDFVDYKSFTITLNGFSLDSEISENHRTKYYELCFSRKSYLHERLLRISNPKLAAEMIVETLNVADAIQGCGIFTSQEDFAIWDKTLQGFELLGLDVDFLRSRLNHLLRLALQFQDTPKFKRYIEAKLEETGLEDDVKTLEEMTNRLKDGKNVLKEEDIMTFETALNRLKDSKNVLQSEIDTLKVNLHRYELLLEEIARAPW